MAANAIRKIHIPNALLNLQTDNFGVYYFRGNTLNGTNCKCLEIFVKILHILSYSHSLFKADDIYLVLLASRKPFEFLIMNLGKSPMKGLKKINNLQDRV